MIPEAWAALIVVTLAVIAYVVTVAGKRKGSGAYEHTNSKGVTFYLHQTQVTLRGGRPQTIYFFRKSVGDTMLQSGKQYQTAQLPADKVVRENPRNGFLTLAPKDSK